MAPFGTSFVCPNNKRVHLATVSIATLAPTTDFPYRLNAVMAHELADHLRGQQVLMQRIDSAGERSSHGTPAVRLAAERRGMTGSQRRGPCTGG